MRKIIVLGVVLLLIQIPLIALVLVQEITWGGPDIDTADAVDVAPDGSLYVAGTTASFGAGGEDAFLLKFAPAGSLEWQRTYGTAPDANNVANESARGVAVSPDGLVVYITGSYRDDSVFLAQFDRDGLLLWQQTWGGGGNTPMGVEVGADGSVYVAGITDFGLGEADTFLLKFAPDGTLLWQRTWGGSLFDPARDLAIGIDGGIYVTGETNSFSGNSAFLVKFAPDGSLLWDREWGIVGVNPNVGSETVAFGVGTAADGTVYITGNSTGAGFLDNIVVVKFGASGAVVWERVGGPGFGSGLDVAVGSNGDVHVTGDLLLEDPICCGSAAFVWTLNSNGKGRGAAIWQGAQVERASGRSIAVGPGGNLAVAGLAQAPPYTFDRGSKNAKTPDAFVIDPAGTVTTPAGAVTIVNALVGEPNGSLIFAGATDAALLRLQP